MIHNISPFVKIGGTLGLLLGELGICKNTIRSMPKKGVLCRSSDAFSSVFRGTKTVCANVSRVFVMPKSERKA
ncbi:MAG: hypothetical protein IIY06_10960, partial [Proteobacteria bacterium]|nr:hypothetical protein [Pseudomonadota bacterium]